MPWISFKERKPEESNRFLITRSSGWDKKGSSFEDWRIWHNEMLKTADPPITHWWDGELDFSLAVQAWKNNHLLN